MRIFGIDPGSARTGYGCVESSASRHHLVACGHLAAPAHATFPEKLKHIHGGLAGLIALHRPDAVAVEGIFHARNVRSALTLGHARGVALLAACDAGLPVFEYSPAEVKRAVVGFGRAEKHQVQQMIMLLLGLETAPAPYDVSDALAIAICHLHSATGIVAQAEALAAPAPGKRSTAVRSWRDYRP